MTEEDAKTKWCPLARSRCDYDNLRATAVNRNVDGSPDTGAFCIASACMAWRSTGGEWISDSYSREEISAAMRPEDADARWVLNGFCGLAGSPR